MSEGPAPAVEADRQIHRLPKPPARPALLVLLRSQIEPQTERPTFTATILELGDPFAG